MKNIWMYWDNYPGQTTPTYIRLCHETIRRHCSKNLQINIVTTENVRDFLPQIDNKFFAIAQINNKSNYLRYKLLSEFGGIWLDSDFICVENLEPMTELLYDGIEVVATASLGLKYGEPECGFLVSTPGNQIIRSAISYVEHMIDLYPPGHIFPWGSLGPAAIRQAVKGRKYHHLDSRLTMPIPSWEAHRFGTSESLERLWPGFYGIMLYHQMFKQGKSPILTMSENELMTSPLLISQIFRKAVS